MEKNEYLIRNVFRVALLFSLWWIGYEIKNEIPSTWGVEQEIRGVAIEVGDLKYRLDNINNSIIMNH
ncbi:hypothetical protein SAMN05192560_0758 [Methylobacillus rhizosphaerae]|uniref:Uncharacterized protein n=1 Tax=Methylobacillus rhizosphaerae TaxID=551994 RepID=A0A238YS37_9PROT|nr:hypothetical protein [Methylobacillus rhizosphaerae]SNR73474.1 hypothetical protein SAMN05192560_0758 [Methylobacillus rhizosphaerae]